MATRIHHLLALLLCQVMMVHAVDFARLCSLRTARIFPVTWDKELESFVFVDAVNGTDKNRTATDDGNRRHLRINEDAAVIPALSVSTQRRQQLDTKNITGHVFYVRRCICAYPPPTTGGVYCPVEKSTCGIPRDTTLPVGCFNQSSRTSLIRNAWPVIVLWYGGLVIFLLFTAQGRNARHYVIQKCCNHNLNNQLVDQYWYVEGGFWRRRQQRRLIPNLLRDLRQLRNTNNERRNNEVPPLPPNTLQHLEQQPQLQQDPDQAPNQLALKTKRYVAPRNNNVEDDDDLACTICFSPLEEGDRVGALACRHEFHVDCLKQWLARRNCCPLCQAPDVAAPRYRPQENNNDDVQQETRDAPDDEERQSEAAQQHEGAQHGHREVEMTSVAQRTGAPTVPNNQPYVDLIRERMTLHHRR